MERLQLEGIRADHVPVERFEVTKVEDDPVSLFNRPFIKCGRMKKVEERVGVAARLLELAAKTFLECHPIFSWCGHHHSMARATQSISRMGL